MVEFWIKSCCSELPVIEGLSWEVLSVTSSPSWRRSEDPPLCRATVHAIWWANLLCLESLTAKIKERLVLMRLSMLQEGPHNSQVIHVRNYSLIDLSSQWFWRQDRGHTWLSTGSYRPFCSWSPFTAFLCPIFTFMIRRIKTAQVVLTGLVYFDRSKIST